MNDFQKKLAEFIANGGKIIKLPAAGEPPKKFTKKKRSNKSMRGKMK